MLPTSRGILPNPTILVIDDEALIRWSLTEGLSESGYRVRHAGSAAEARLALARSAGEPLLVILDLRLPDVADLSFLREVRAARPEAPIVIISAHAPDSVIEVTRLGVYRFVSKPFEVAEMTEIVESAWAHRAEQAAGEIPAI